MFAPKRDKKEEEEGGGNPFQSLEKTSVLQEARTFNETPVNARRCTFILTKVLYLINQGEGLGTTEATEAFFAMTKLFQSKDVVLRRMVYLAIKELAPLAEDVIIVTSSLTKDMTGKEDAYRAAAIRALCAVTDSTMLQAIERYMKQAIVDKAGWVSSAALVSSVHLVKAASSSNDGAGAGATTEVVKRWLGEAQEALNSDSPMVQFHALGLLYQLRRSDRLAVTKLVARLTRGASVLKSPLALCLLIRICSKLVEDGEEGGLGGPSEAGLMDFLESCLRHKSETVTFESASAVVRLRRGSAPRELVPAVSVLQLFCSSPKPSLRFAAVRTLSRLAASQPAAVAACNLDLENLVSDQNRAVATLAITTLLKTGAEASVDRLMKQIASFVSEISDEFKVVVVQAVRSLCLKFPRKHSVLMGFLSAMLRDEGGLDYKAAIADTIIAVLEENPEAKETGLAHLCEFIEDCEHTSLAVRILHLLGREGPDTRQPSRYIRYIYNRVILENPAVRAAAVSALAQFGARCPDLLPNVLVLLARCQVDTDDEVRDRATYCRATLLSGVGIDRILPVSAPALEKALVMYLQQPKNDTPFDFKAVPPAPVKESDPEIAPVESRKAPPVEELPPQLAFLGVPFRSGEPTQLSEAETEYVVRCTKLVFSSHLLLHFRVRNTLSDLLLERVRVHLEASGADPGQGLPLEAELSAPRLACGQEASCYALFRLESLSSGTSGSMAATLKFVAKDCDPATGMPDSEEGYDDDYLLEDVDLSIADHMQRVALPNFQAAWDSLSPDNPAPSTRGSERQDTFALGSLKTLQEAAESVTKFLGMQPCERTDRVLDRTSAHTLLLAGVFRGGHDVLVRSKLVQVPEGVTMQITVRSSNAEVAEIVASSIG